MKHFITIATAFLLTLGTQAAPYTQNAVQLADSAYRAGNYEEAVSAYEEVLSQGLASADLYYNLGNAYYRTDRMGLAILNYERALRLKPSMGDARENLALAESKTADRITTLPKLFVVRWVDVLCIHITPAVWRVVWLVLLALLGLSLVAMRLGSSRNLRKAGLLSAVLSVVLLLLATLLLISSTRRFNAHREAIVLPQAVTVKSSPEQQGTDKLVLHEGTKLTITDSLSGWYKITIADGTSGWCQKENVERI
ncbi:MAG: tetratricopeptide repeat protein [Bacteroidales bacterium]|nr:tetratricopeptide repeat protein [Bacteroidales bacterium]